MATSEIQATIVAVFESGHFVSVQPSLLAAVAYRAHRERQGVLPIWPTALQELTGWGKSDPGTASETASESEFHDALVMMRQHLESA